MDLTMTPTLTLFLTTLAAALALMFVVWLMSLVRRDVSIIDAFWGPGFALVALVALLTTTGFEGRRWLLLTLTVVWGLRLGGYLLWRNLKAGEEDYRYRAMRQRHGARFPLVSLFTVFGLQAVLLWFIALPVQVAIAAAAPARWSWLDGLGVGVWAVGLFFEVVGDGQLARFKADPANRGKVLDTGLWRYTRHPNYFGDFLVWWGLFLIALSVPDGWKTVASPLLMSFFLMKVSGVPLLEGKLAKTRPGYREYVERTNAFFPGPPR
jgi:steroid 5-alpha reductase family enzyme